MVLMAVGAAQAQTNGYHRLKNVATGHVATLPGKHVFAPNVTEEEACSQPGTVAYFEFDSNQVTHYRAQGTEVVNELAPLMKIMFKTAISEDYYYDLRQEMINTVRASYTGAMGDLLVSYMSRYTYEDFLNYIDAMDTNMYYRETEGGYYLYFKSPAFPLDAGDFTEYFTTKVNTYMSAFRGRLQQMVTPYFADKQEVLPMIYSMIGHLRFGDYFYFTERETEDNGIQFGFANSLDYANEGMNDVWTFVPVDNEDHYIGVNGQCQDAAGKWYASYAVGFPFRMASGMKAYYADGVVDVSKSLVRWREVSGDVIPALTPVILVLNGEKASENKLEVLEDDGGVYIEDNYLKLATNKHDFLLGKQLEEPDTHHYVLGMVHGKPSLVENEQTFFAPNEAYYLEDIYKQYNPSGYLTFSTDVSGVETVAVETNRSDEVFDLQGRRVTHPGKGIYIVNGKKIVIR